MKTEVSSRENLFNGGGVGFTLSAESLALSARYYLEEYHGQVADAVSCAIRNFVDAGGIEK